MFTCKPVENRSDLSSYEILRINNIIRNNTKLRELGLISESEEKKSNLAAQGISDVDDNKESVNSLDKSKRKQTKRKRQTIKQGSRKSPRLQNLQAAEAKSIDHEKESSSSEDIEKERIVRVEECRQVRLRAAKAIAEAGAEKASKENPTASYEHCLMRVKTMTPKKLENRIRAIERAAGKFCIVKMAIFKSCLQDEGKWDLADKAGEALERLKGSKGCWV